MAESRSLTRISEADYEAIECAVMETERGRWFLKEFSRRNRSADTEILLQAIDRLEQAVAGERTAHDIDRFRFDLAEMSKAIARSKMEIAAIRPPHQEHSRLLVASEALDSITRTTEQATSDILEAAEHIQEAAWTLREDGADRELCDALDRRATEIYTACSFQDLTAQRTTKIVQTLRYLEDRITAMMAIWGADPIEAPPDGPALSASQGQAADDLTQHDIDNVIVDDRASAPADEARLSEEALAGRDVADEDVADEGFADEDFADEDFADESLANSRPAGDPLAGDTVPAAPADPDEGAAWAQDRSPGPEPELEPALAPRMHLDAFAEIDALPVAEKLRRFT